jgi:hypothetical protein
MLPTTIHFNPSSGTNAKKIRKEIARENGKILRILRTFLSMEKQVKNPKLLLVKKSKKL